MGLIRPNKCKHNEYWLYITKNKSHDSSVGAQNSALTSILHCLCQRSSSSDYPPFCQCLADSPSPNSSSLCLHNSYSELVSLALNWAIDAAFWNLIGVLCHVKIFTICSVVNPTSHLSCRDLWSFFGQDAAFVYYWLSQGSQPESLELLHPFLRSITANLGCQKVAKRWFRLVSWLLTVNVPGTLLKYPLLLCPGMCGAQIVHLTFVCVILKDKSRCILGSARCEF